METVKCGSVVAIRDDDMGRAVWDLVRKRLVQPYVDDDPRLFDLSIEHRNQTNDTIYLEAAQAYKMHNVGVKCATITAEKDVLEKYHLKRLWMSPNGAIRNAHGGDVFRKPIACRNIPPLMNHWRRSIIIARHAFGDQYNSQDFVVPGPGTLQIKYSPSIGATYNHDARCRVRNFLGGVGAQLAKRECLELQAMPRIKQASKSDLELEAAALRKERDDLAAILSSQRNTKSAAVNKVAEQQRKCIQEPEDSGNQLHKTVNAQPRMIRLKEDAERSAKKLQQEISQAWVQLKKPTKEESESKLRQQTERIREVCALRIREQQQQQLTQMARMERQNTLRTNVSQRRVEDALAAKNRLEAAQHRRLENRAYDSRFDSMTSRVKDFSTKPAPAGTTPFRLKRIREDYEAVIRKNISLQAECEVSKLQEECNNLKEDLSKALAEKSDFRARLDSVECEVGELRFELGMKTHELDALVSFYSNREKPLLRSSQAPPVCVSCYMEPHMVELQETNAKLQQESCRLQSELEETTARSTSDRGKMASHVKELEDGHARLKHDNQALEDRIGDVEVKLNNQLELQRNSEEECVYEWVTEGDAHKDALRQQIDELTAEAVEERLQAELEELQNQCEGCKTLASHKGQLTAEK